MYTGRLENVQTFHSHLSTCSYLHQLYILYISENYILSPINRSVYFQWELCIYKVLSIYPVYTWSLYNVASTLMQCQSFSKACISRATFYNCVSQFREGRTSMRDKHRPAEAVTPTMVVNGEVFVKTDQRVTLQEVANQFIIGKVRHLHKKLDMSKVSARWVLK